MQRISLVALSLGLALSSCAPQAIGDAPTPVATNVGPVTGSPTEMEEFQGATILDIDRYRPTRTMPSCKQGSLLRAEAPDDLAPALEAAQAYSDAEQGIGLIVLKDGAVIHQQFADGTNAATKTVSASMMKSVLAMLVGIAIERGFIGSVDDPASRYLPEWANDERAAITLRDLLTMSSGLEPQPFTEFLFADNANFKALSATSAKPPRSEFRYNNGVSQVLGAILDRQVKLHGHGGFAEFLYSEFWCPLGAGEALLWTDTNGMPRAYAGLHAGLEDWARVGELVRNGGRANGRQIVPEAWLEEMVQPSPSNPRYGYQIWLAGGWQPTRSYVPEGGIAVPHKEPFAADDLVFFDGFGGQRVYVIPSEGLIIARTGMTNLEFDDSVIPNLLVRAGE